MAKKKRVRKPEEYSLAQLQQLVQSKASEVSDLKAQRAEKQRELDEIDRQIASAEGTAKKRGRPGRPPGTAAPTVKRKKAAKKVRRPRPKNKKSQKDYAIDILKANPQGLPLDQLADAILESGYKSNSKSFKNTLYQMLYNSRKAGKAFNYNEKTHNWVLR
jgi:hypothetical protein